MSSKTGKAEPRSRAPCGPRSRSSHAPTARVPLHLSLLGSFRLMAEETELRLPTRKAAVLLARLATTRELQARREQLAAFLWEGAETGQARASLRQTLSRIRQTLGEHAGAVWSDNESIGLHAECWRIDLLEIESVATGGRDDGRAIDHDWINEFLLGLQLKESAADLWLEAERRRCRDTVFALFGQRLSMALEAGEAGTAIDIALRLLTLDPLAEPVHRDLMRAYELARDRTRALQAYRTLERSLGRELDVLPESETRRLYEIIRDARDTDEASRLPGSARLPQPRRSRATVAPTRELRLVTLVHLHQHETTPGERDASDRCRSVMESLGARFCGGRDEDMTFGFGLREGADDDARRALRACCELLSEPDLSLSIGCASGLVAWDETRPLVGSVASRAHRLAVLGESGDVLLDVAVKQQIGECATLDEEGLRDRVWYRLTSFADERIAAPAPFTGRRMELLQLVSLLEQARSEGGAIAIVSGVPGVGKSRLAEELAERAKANGFRVLHVAFSPLASQSFRTVRRLARLLVDGVRDNRGSIPDDCRHLVTRLQRQLAPEDDAPRDATGSPRPDEDPGAIAEGLHGLLRALSERQPALLVVDDCHWADSVGLHVLDELCRRLRDVPSMLLMTERIGQERVRPIVQARSIDATLFTVSLSPLRDADARALAASLLGADDARLDALVRRAAGNPLFLVRLAEAQGELDSELPPTVIALVQQQLDRAAPGVRRACQLASAIGPRFERRDLAGAFPDADEAELMRSGFLRYAADEVDFVHALVHEAIYATIATAWKAKLHERLASHFEAHDPLLAAEHALRGADPTLIARICALAAEHAWLHNRAAFAEHLVEAGLEAGGTPDERALVLQCRAALLRDRGELGAAVAAAHEAAETAASVEVRVRARIRLAALLKFRGEQARAETIIKAAAREACAGAGVSDAVRSDLESELGNIAFVNGDVERCLAHHRAALEHAERGGHPLQRARALGGMGDAHYAALRLRSAIASFEACVAYAESRDLVDIAEAHRHMIGYSRFLSDPGEGALAAAREAVTSAATGGSLQHQVIARVGLLELLLFAMELDEALAESTRIDALNERLGRHRYDADRALTNVLSHLAHGEHEWACRAARAALEDFATPFLGPTFAALVALLTADDGERERALQWGGTVNGRGGVAHGRIYFSLFSAFAHLRAGDIERALASTDALERLTRTEPSRLVELAAGLVRAVVGRDDEARERLIEEIDAARIGLIVPLVNIATGH